jgi:Flp pilus assembly protein TadD
LKYISFNLNDKKAYNNLGILYDKLEKYELAIDLFTKAIDLDPKLAAAYANM